MPEQNCGVERLPECVGEYVRAVVKKMGYRRRVRDEVARELADHFADALADCTDDQERQRRAARLIEDFGDAKLLAVLIRRGKKRCRPAWKKAIIRSFQTCGVLLVLMILYTGWFVSGQAKARVDYVSMFNEKSRPTFGGRGQRLALLPARTGPVRMALRRHRGPAQTDRST